tara:strand:+ start:1577 stop:2365 length:789 start_codon:yes stop_codon:yes gene_type:complete
MELSDIIERIVSLLPDVDENLVVLPARNGNQYISSIGAAKEPDFIGELMVQWSTQYPSELPGIVVEKASTQHPDGCLERPYVQGSFTGDKADIGITTISNSGSSNDWIIEVKKIEFVGDVAFKSTHQETGVATMLSPFPITRGVIHDVGRVLSHPEGARKAVIVYAFTHDSTVAQSAANHPENAAPVQQGRACNRSNNLTRLLTFNGDVAITIETLLEPFELLCQSYDHNLGIRNALQFSGLSQHPTYTQGHVVGWEVFEQD